MKKLLLTLMLLGACSAYGQFIRFEANNYAITPSNLLFSNMLGDGIQIIKTNSSRIILKAIAQVSGETNTLVSQGNNGKGIVNPKVGTELRLKSFLDTPQTVWSTNATNIAVAIPIDALLTNLNVWRGNYPALELHSASDGQNLLSVIRSGGIGHGDDSALDIGKDSAGGGRLVLKNNLELEYAWFESHNTNFITSFLGVGTPNSGDSIRPGIADGRLHVYQSATYGNKPVFIAENGDPSQTNDLTQWRTNGTTIAKMDKSGLLTLGGDATAALHAVTKQQMDAAVGAGGPNFVTKINSSPFTNTGPVTVTGGLTNTGASQLASSYIVDSGVAQLTLKDINAALNAKNWAFQSVGGLLRVRAVNDLVTDGLNSLVINRSGITSVTSYFENGNLGIGETSPGSKLSVSGNATIGAGYDTTAAPANGLVVEGNVGIGATTPLAKLTVKESGGSGFVNIGQLGGASANSGIAFSITPTNVQLNNYSILGDGANTLLSRPLGGDMFFREANSDQMILKATTGNVGIATNNPQTRLHVHGNATVASNVTAQTLRLNDSSGSASTLLVSGVSKGLRFGVSASQANIEGVDQTGSASYQPLHLSGSTTALGAGGLAKLTVAADGRITIVTNVTINVESTLTVGRNPTAALEVATKQYTDASTNALRGNLLGQWLPLGAAGLTNVDLSYPRRYHTLTGNETINLTSSTSTYWGIQIQLYTNGAASSVSFPAAWVSDSGGSSPISITGPTLLVIRAVTNKVHIDWSGTNAGGGGTITTIAGFATNLTVQASNLVNVPLIAQPRTGTATNAFQVNFTNQVAAFAISGNGLTASGQSYLANSNYSTTVYSMGANDGTGTNFVWDVRVKSWTLREHQITNLINVVSATNQVEGQSWPSRLIIHTGNTNRHYYQPVGWYRGNTNTPILLSSNRVYIADIESRGTGETNVYTEFNAVALQTSYAPQLVGDAVGANVWAMYSTARKLKYAYAGPLIFVREYSGAQSSAPIYADASGRLDTNAIKQFIIDGGSTDAYVESVCDQSGNGRHITNSISVAQIAHSSTLIRTLSTGHPAPFFTIAGNTPLTNFSGSFPQPATVYWVGQGDTYQNSTVFYGGGASGRMEMNYSGSTDNIAIFAGTASSDISITDEVAFMTTATFSGANSSFSKNRGLQLWNGNAGTAAPDGFTVGADGPGIKISEIHFAEAFIFTVDDPDGGARQLYLQDEMCASYGF